MTTNDRTKEARRLLHDFLARTGLRGATGDLRRRYLWTDAFAVRTCLALAGPAGEDEDASYRKDALRLIDEVHGTLGRHRDDDPREGWISGLPKAEGERQPTAGGLRIGKRLPERAPDEPFDEQLEWERDGQYFHYLTQWWSTLLLTGRETGEDRYTHWAADLARASGNFVVRNNGASHMSWKMSIDLTRPLVPGMGTHDPLSGLLGVEEILHQSAEKSPPLETLRDDFALLCRSGDWATADSLGAGGLLRDLLCAARLEREGRGLPDSAASGKLLEASVHSLSVVARAFDPNLSAHRRLAFRECGLSLGLRAVESAHDSGVLPESCDRLSEYFPLAREIEDFWLESDNQQAESWAGHLDINAVTLAASLAAPLLSAPSVQGRRWQFGQ